MGARRIIYLIIGLALAASVLTLWRAGVQERAAEAAYPAEGQFVDVDGTRMHVVVRGDGPDLVLIHGASGSTRDFTFSLADRLAEDWRVIVIDRPGFGWSALPDQFPDLGIQAHLLQGAAAAVGAERPVVLGHSYGGAVAIRWALDHPDNISGLLMLAAASHPWDSDLPTLYKWQTNPLTRWAIVPLIAAFAPASMVTDAVASVFEPNAVPAGYADYFGPAMTLRRQTQRVNARQRKVLNSEVTVMAPRYPNLALPVEILHGTADSTVSLSIHAEPLAADVPGAVLTRLDGIGHMPHHTAPDAIEAALDRLASRAGLRPGGATAIVGETAEEANP